MGKVKLMLKLHSKNDRESESCDTRYAHGMTGSCVQHFIVPLCVKEQ